jgi:Xaa-Pro dipeptidase
MRARVAQEGTDMKSGYIDRVRAERLMREAGIDVLLVVQPENFAYATGGTPGIASSWRRVGAAIAVVPAAAGAEATAIITDFGEGPFRNGSGIRDVRTHTAWVDNVDVAPKLPSNRPIAELIAEAQPERAGGFLRPPTFDARRALGLAREALSQRGLLGARIGVEFDFLPVNDLRMIEAALPEAKLVDSSPLFDRLRMIKTPAEIELLRKGAALAEAGIRAVMASLHVGQTRAAISELWRATVLAEAKRQGVGNLTGQWDYTAVGPDPWSPHGVVEHGSVVKIDVGCVLSGYSSDSARTFCFGRASAHARGVYEGLRAAFEAGRAVFRPGHTLGDVHAACIAAMRAHGFTTFMRGHFGHGIGQNVWSEEWPYTGHGVDVVLEPGMVMAFETPYYVNGVGAFIIEDQFLVTETGHETMNTLPYEFQEFGV